MVDIHKIITSNKLTSNLLKPWGSNYDRKSDSKSKSLREKCSTNIRDQQIKFIYKSISTLKQVKYTKFMISLLVLMIIVVCSMIYHSVAENIGKNNKDVKRLKHLADDKWLKCFKPRSPWDIAAYSAIKSKRTL